MFVTLLFVGLAFIALAIWLAYGFALKRAEPSDDLGWIAVSGRTIRAETTRDAQQLEIARMSSELERTRQELATASARPSPSPPPVSSSAAWERPPLALILDAPVYKQQRSLSCESSAAAMAANFFGVWISEQNVLDALPRHENPHQGFRGNVDGSYGGIEDYGVYAEPIRQALARWGLQVEVLNGGLEAIREHIRQERLIIAWVTYDLQVQVPRQVTLGNGRSVTLIPYEHAVLVVGYNRDGLWVNDPYSGTQTFYSESDFARSFAYLGNMGLVVGAPGSQ
jgi:uncharacterized protein YvpB